jgi:integrase
MADAKKLPSGNWRVRVFVGTDENGKQIRKSFTAPTKWEALRLAEDFIERGKDKPREMTVGQAIDEYINAKSNVLSPTTIQLYKTIRNNDLQSLMKIELKKLTAVQIQQAVNQEATRLSPKGVRNAHGLLSASLKMFYPEFVLHTTLPQVQRKIKVLPAPSEVFNIIKGTEIELPCMLAMWMSLRMSEIRGLKFSDIKDDIIVINRSKVYVNGEDVIKDENKTASSKRMHRIPEYIKNLIDNADHSTEFLVNLSRNAIYKRFTRLMAKHDIKMTFHDLRHLNASVMMTLGIPDKYAMERGGWSTDNVLKSVYQHTFSTERVVVDNKIDSYFNNIVGQEVSATVDTKMDTKEE